MQIARASYGPGIERLVVAVAAARCRRH
jgi:hypothetical protein